MNASRASVEPGARPLRGSRQFWWRCGPGYLLVLPAMAVVVLVILYPLVRGIEMSFESVTLFTLAHPQHTFVGLANYLTALAGPVFWQSLGNTVVWTLANLVMQMVLGMVIALLLSQRLRGQGVARSLVLVPWIVPSVVAVLTWRWMYDPNNGILSYWLTRLGFGSGAADLLGNVGTALGAIIAESVWKGTPFVVILFLAGLQTIPQELYEAARMDGAHNRQVLHFVIVPMMKRTIAIASILTTVFTINNFNSIWLMTRGGPLHASDTLLTLAYRTAFQNYDLGQASAVSVAIFVVLMIISSVYISLVERGG